MAAKRADTVLINWTRAACADEYLTLDTYSILLWMAFSGLRSIVFCSVGRSRSLNSEWDTWRSREPLLSRMCCCGFVLLMRTDFMYRSNRALWKISVDTKLMIVVSNTATWDSVLHKKTNLPCASLLSLCLCEPCRSLNKSPAWPEWWGSGPDSTVCWSIDPPVQDSVKGDKMVVSINDCIRLSPQ